MQKKSFSWMLIVLMLFLFFPVAIYMIISKMSSEKFNYMKNGKSLKTLGMVLLCLAGTYLIIGLTNAFIPAEGDSSIWSGMISCTLIFGVSGAFCIFKGTEYIKLGAKYSRYVSIINTNNNLFIDNIAAAVPTTYDQAIIDIQSMLDSGFFMNAYLDLNRRELIMAKASTNRKANNEHNASDNVTNSQPHSVKCQNCGAPNKIVQGTKNECEYCGSAL